MCVYARALHTQGRGESKRWRESGWGGGGELVREGGKEGGREGGETEGEGGRKGGREGVNVPVCLSLSLSSLSLSLSLSESLCVCVCKSKQEFACLRVHVCVGTTVYSSALAYSTRAPPLLLLAFTVICLLACLLACLLHCVCARRALWYQLLKWLRN